MNKDVLIKREQLAKNVVAKLNNFIDLRNTLSTIINEIKEITAVEAISIRLFEEGDYPYFVSEGFPSSFLKHENSIHSQTHTSTENKNGSKYNLDCMCGKVINGNIDSKKDYYTKNGSYWTNNSTEIAATLVAEDKEVNIRNHCNACGYESIGLFPIKTRDENIGIIQLNDKRTDFFTSDLIEFLEMLGQQIGIAVENAILYERLKNKNTELENTIEDLSKMQEQMIEAKKTSVLADMVVSIAHEIYSPITLAYSSSAKSLEIAYNLAEKDTGYANEISNLSSENKKALKSIEEIRELIRSFKAIAIDQFQESRQLINLKQFVTNVINVMKPSLTEAEVSFNVECKDQMELMSYSGALSQIFTQLINNSYQHGFRTRSSGEIKIACKIAHNDSIEIIYSDNGIGLLPETKHKIFEPFFTTDRRNHTGLGLTIIENLIQNKLKGSVDVSTSVDDGVEFRFLIPY